MANRYYFDNQQGYKLFAQELAQAGVYLTRHMRQKNPQSIFLKYKHILDPTAEITYNANDADAIRLIEVSWPSELQTKCLMSAIDKIKVTKNTIVVNFFEPFAAKSKLTARGIKCISLPWDEKDSSLSRSIPLIYPLLIGREEDDYTGNFPKVEYFKNLNKSYKFLNLCGKVYPWKFMLYAGIHHEGLADQGLISVRWQGSARTVLRGVDNGLQDGSWHNGYFKNYQGSKYWDTAVRLFKQKQVLDLGEDSDPITARRRYSHKPSWYSSTWMSLVTESTTSSNNDYPCITEKTIAPLVAGHPFVVYGENNIMPLLKDIGFDVYDWLFEHKQLTEQQHLLSRNEQDIIKVENVLNDVKNFTKEKVLDNQKLVAEAIAHNQNVMDTGYLKIVTEEWQRVIGELTN